MKRRNEAAPRKKSRQRGTGDRMGTGSEPVTNRSARKRVAAKLRIIGGSFRGRTIRYHGGPQTRPMRDSVRESLFNILGEAVRGTRSYDLFAGTGALSFEALSRGASAAVAVDSSRMAVRQLKETARQLDVERRIQILVGDAFRLSERLLSPPSDDTAWLVFLCPPYAMWTSEKDFESLAAIIDLGIRNAPPGSLIVAETDKRFDPERLPGGAWDVRVYGDTRLAVLEAGSHCGLR